LSKRWTGPGTSSRVCWNFPGLKEFTLKPTLLKTVVDRSIRLISSQVPAGIDIVEDVPDDLMLHLDAQRMQEAFLNLFMNSVQAIETPRARLRLRPGWTKRSDGW
jgi:two-component system, NtrC family, sensor kinase